MRYEHVREAYQRYEVFSSDSIDPLDPDPAYRFIPTLVNPPDHVKYRQVLNAWFSPAAVARITPTARQICVANIDRIVEQGSCDFIEDFALRYPTEVFLGILGLPVEDAEMFVPLVDRFFVSFYGEDKSPIAEIAGTIQGYFADVLADRRRQPAGPGSGLRHLPAPSATVFDRPLSRAGDPRHLLRARPRRARHHAGPVRATCGTTSPPTTTTAAASPPTRRSAKDAIEETLRLYTIIIGDGRKIAQDCDFHGVPLRAGSDGVAVGGAAPTATRGCSRTRRAFKHRPLRQQAPRLRRRPAPLPGRPPGPPGDGDRARGVAPPHPRLPPRWRRPVYERGGMLTLFSLPLEWEV